MAAAEHPVNDVNRRFYQAFESLDLGRMESIWLREDYVKCVHPGWALLSGWDAVMESWRRIFENTQRMRFTLTNVEARARGGLAWVTLYENLDSTLEGQTNAAVVLATNIYEQRPDGWFMIHHHGSPVMMPRPDPHPTVQ